MQVDTIFDMASCTKVLATNTASALLYQWGALHLDVLASDASLLGHDYAQNGKDRITVRHLLLHNSGLPPDPSPNYWAKSYGCPETQKARPDLNFSCRQKIWRTFLATTATRGPNIQYVYSDLNFMSMAFIVGKISSVRGYTLDSDLLPNCLIDPEMPNDAASDAATFQCHYEAFVRKYVAGRRQLKSTGFLPPQSVWGMCAPTENDTIYLGKTIQGQVSDGNAYAMGGIAGHAGLFTNALEAHAIMREWLFGDDSNYLNATTTKLWTKQNNHTQSSRTLGWNTNDPDVFDSGWDLSCGHKLSAATFMHTGYTGTEVCADPLFPTGPLITILLTNRVYPTDQTGTAKIHATRQAYNDAVYSVLTSRKESS
jgi:CubicO group peptidase (beta-lactamase class C family)